MIDSLKKLWLVLKVTIGLSRARNAASNERGEDALSELLKLKPILYGKDCEYHFHLSRQLTNVKSDYSEAIKVTEEGMELLVHDMDKGKYSGDCFNYLMAWAKYTKGLDLHSIRHYKEAEDLRYESEQYFFNIEKVKERFKIDFPMTWHVDYKMEEKLSST